MVRRILVGLILLASPILGDTIRDMPDASSVTATDGFFCDQGAGPAVTRECLASQLAAYISGAISDDSVTPDMVLTSGQSDGLCLTYQLSGDTWAWAACGAGAGDMLKSVYDSGDDGDVDSAETLSGVTTNCAAGSYPLGIDSAGATESCTDASTEIDSIVATHDAIADAHYVHATSLGDLNTDLGSTIADGPHTATAITDGLIVEADLDEDSGTPTDEDVLTYDSTGANFNWIAQSGITAGNVADADYTDIVVSGGVWNIDANTVGPTEVGANVLTEGEVEGGGSLGAGEDGYVWAWNNGTGAMEFVSNAAGAETDPTLTDDTAVTIGDNIGADIVLTFDSTTDATITWDLSALAFVLSHKLSVPAAAAPAFTMTDSDTDDEDLSAQWTANATDTDTTEEDIDVQLAAQTDGLMTPFISYDADDGPDGGDPALHLGDSTLGELTVTTDSTGNGEVVLPNDSIGADEIWSAGQADGECLIWSTGDVLSWGTCGSGAGDVTGPGPTVTDDAVATFNGTGGLTIQESNLIVADDGTVTVGGSGSLVQGDGVGDLDIDANGQNVTIGDAAGNEIAVSDAGATTFAGTASLAVPNGATPTTDATAEIALDTTIVDHQPLLQYYDGAENMTVIAIDTAQLPAQDDEIVKYDAGTDKFVLEADAGAAGGDSIEIDSVAVVDPDFQSTGDIDFTDTSNVVTADINAGVIVEGDLNEDSGTPTDEDVLTYDSTGANFNWVAQSGLAAGTAAALAANGGNCAAGEVPLGVDTAGAVEGCYEPTEADITDLAHTATGIQDGLIVEADLDEDSGTPTDGDILTYDSTGANFNWIAEGDIDHDGLTNFAAAEHKLHPTSTDEAIARYTGTAGDLQNSSVTISDAGALVVGGAASLIQGNGTSDLDIDANGQNVTLGDGGTTNYIQVTDGGAMTAVAGASIDATTGDSATAFFDAGEIEKAYLPDVDALDLTGSTDHYVLQATGATTYEFDWPLVRYHATDCAGLTDGEQGDICWEADANVIYVCETATCNAAGWTSATAAGDGVGYDTVEEADTPLTQRANLNFLDGTRATMSCADDVDTTDCTVEAVATLSSYTDDLSHVEESTTVTDNADGIDITLSTYDIAVALDPSETANQAGDLADLVPYEDVTDGGIHHMTFTQVQTLVADGTGTDDQNLSVTAGGADDSVIDIENGNDVTISGSSLINVTEAASTITIAAEATLSSYTDDLGHVEESTSVTDSANALDITLSTYDITVDLDPSEVANQAPDLADLVVYEDVTDGGIHQATFTQVQTLIDTGGAETNDLESVMTGALSGEIPIGTTAGGVAAYVGLQACANDEKLEYTDGTPDTMTCEAINGLVDADIGDISNLAAGAVDDLGELASMTCTGDQYLARNTGNSAWECVAEGAAGSAISAGDSDVTVTDAGTGDVTITVDSTQVGEWTVASGLSVGPAAPAANGLIQGPGSTYDLDLDANGNSVTIGDAAGNEMDVTDAGITTWAGTGYASLNANSIGTTAAADDNDTTVATTAFVQQEHDDSAGSCTNQFVRGVNADAAPTCATVTVADITTAPAISGANIDSFPQNFSKTLFDDGGLSDTDDIGPVWMAPAASTVTGVWCESDTGALTITLEDDTGNDLTTGCDCDAGTQCSLTGNVAYTAGERMEFIMVSAGTNDRVFFDVRYDLD